MSWLVSRSTTIYRLLARLYPDEMRRRWEPEMADTFALQLADAVREERWSGVIATWYCALAELFQIALPSRLARAALVVPMAALAGAGAIFYGLAWALQNSQVLEALYHHAFARLGG
jgi:hypothetical protein